MISLAEHNSLNLIRWLSTIAIVVCHILQGYDNDYAFVFNVGVQVFFILSGFLYGTRRIESIKKFYIKRISKLYIPYCIWVFIAVGLLMLFSSENITGRSIMLQICMISNLPGLNHLWFMRVIFICYLLLPIFDRSLNKKPTVTIMCAVALSILVLTYFYKALFVWIIIYFIGYCMGRYRRIMPYVFIVGLIITLLIFDYQGFLVNAFLGNSILCNIIHATCGLTIFIGLLKIGELIRTYPSVIQRISELGGGYEVYLTHHILILGPLSLLFITSYSGFNIVIIIILIVILSYILQKLSFISNTVIRKLIK